MIYRLLWNANRISVFNCLVLDFPKDQQDLTISIPLFSLLSFNLYIWLFVPCCLAYNYAFFASYHVFFVWFYHLLVNKDLCTVQLRGIIFQCHTNYRFTSALSYDQLLKFDTEKEKKKKKEVQKQEQKQKEQEEQEDEEEKEEA